MKSCAKILLIILAASLVHAQPSSLTLYSLTESNGLSDNRVTCAFQDHNGFMWIGTEDGLNRYDGSAFTIFKQQKANSQELTSNFIHAIVEDNQHHLWIATHHGLSEYNPQEKSFHSWQAANSKSNVMLDVKVDDQRNVWIGTLGGLLQFNIDKKKFSTHLISSTDGDNRVKNILIDKKKRFWVTTHSGLWRFYPERNSFEHIVFGKNQQSVSLINAIAEGSDGKLWLGYWEKGLQCYDPDNTNMVTINHAPYHIKGIATLFNRNNESDIWCNDLMRVDNKNNITEYSLQTNPQFYDYQVRSLYSSNDNLLWLCTDKGVLIMDPMKQYFHHYFFSKKITNQGIALQQSQNDILVGGSGDNFFMRYDSSFHLKKSYSLKSEFFHNKKPSLLSIVKEGEENIWWCTELGLVLFNEQKSTQQLFQINEKECNAPTRNFFNNLFIDSHKIHWAFPWRAGIWQLDVTHKKFNKVIDGVTLENGKPKNLLISTAVEDALSNIWFADLDEGLIYYKRDQNTFSKPAEKYFGKQFTLSNIFYESPYIWGVSSGYIFRIHEQTQKIDLWSIPQELNKLVSGFCSDLQNHLWIATRNGLLSFDRVSHQFLHFSTNDGLHDNVMTGTIFCLKNGEIVYGDNNYITTFNPKELFYNKTLSKIEITNVLSQEQPLSISIQDGKKYIELDYTYNNFAFDWALLNYSNPLENKYYCQLSDVDKEWRYVGNTGHAQYASLAPSKYVFKVRGTTSDHYQAQQDELLIIIRPPFWKTWWFYLLCGISFLGLSYSFYKYRLNEALKTERLRNKISADLHDEIGSTLSSISIMSDLVAHKIKEEETSEIINEIHKNTLTLMEKMDDIVWSINPNNDSFENLLLRLKHFAAQLFEAKNIDYEITISPTINHLLLTMEFRQNIYLILKEAINNLAKHSKCTQAKIEVTQHASFLELTVADNGQGFDSENSSTRNGIVSMKTRANKMKVDFDIHSSKETGTVVKLRMKIK